MKIKLKMDKKSRNFYINAFPTLIYPDDKSFLKYMLIYHRNPENKSDPYLTYESYLRGRLITT